MILRWPWGQHDEEKTTTRRMLLDEMRAALAEHDLLVLALNEYIERDDGRG